MPNFKKNPTPFMMKGKSPMMKALIGKQKNPIMLTEKGKKAIMASDANAGFKAAIEDAPLDMKHGTPNKMYGKAKNPLMKYKTSMKKKKPLKERSRAEQRAVFASGYKG